MIEQADLLGRLERVEKSRGGWTARCPAHDDRESSLFIWHEDEVRSRLQCRVGCTPAEIAGAIEIAVSQLRPDQVVRYPYYESYGAVRAADARLVVLDPLLSIMSPSGASCTDQELRSTLAKLARVAARTRAAVLVTRDLYGEKEDHLLERGDGIRNISGVWTRLVAGPNPADNRRSVLRRIASDRSTTSVALLQFAMAVNATGVPSIAWSTPPHAHESSCRLTRRRRQGRPALDAAVKLLRELLADGPMFVAEVAQAADSAGMKMPTVRRAKSQLEVESKKQRQPGSDIQAWMWVLPEGDPLRRS